MRIRYAWGEEQIEHIIFLKRFGVLYSLLFGGFLVGELVIHLEFDTDLVVALGTVGVGVGVVGRRLAGELGADVVQVGERHFGQDMRLQVVDDAVKDVRGNLNVFAVEAGLVVDVDAELLPVLADDGQDDVVLRDQVVLLAREGDDTVVQVFGLAVAVLCNVAVGGNLVGFVHMTARRLR